MNVEIILSDATVIQQSKKQIELKSTVMTAIKDVKDRTQSSIEGICVQVKIIGQAKHQFCTIQNDDGKEKLCSNNITLISI